VPVDIVRQADENLRGIATAGAMAGRFETPSRLPKNLLLTKSKVCVHFRRCKPERNAQYIAGHYLSGLLWKGSVTQEIKWI
jgi:hypothetical protein